MGAGEPRRENRGWRFAGPAPFLPAMQFWLKKFVTFWLMPLPFCLTLLVAGLWLTRSAKRAR